MVSGSPVVFDGLSDALETGVLLLAAVALVLMSIALGGVFGSAWRLLPLRLALGSIAISFGILRLFGGSISLAALGVAADPDRPDRRLRGADPGPLSTRSITSFLRPRRRGSPLRAGLPMIATACLASAFGFAALFVSAGAADLRVRPAPRRRCPDLPAGRLPARFRRARDPRAGHAPTRWSSSGSASSTGSGTAPSRRSAWRSSPRAGCCVVSLVIAACGWVAGTQATAGDRDQPAAAFPDRCGRGTCNDLEDSTGTSGEIDLIVRAEDVTDPEVVAWMD